MIHQFPLLYMRFLQHLILDKEDGTLLFETRVIFQYFLESIIYLVNV